MIFVLQTGRKPAHAWDSIKHLNFHSLLGSSTLKYVKRYLTMTKEEILRETGDLQLIRSDVGVAEPPSREGLGFRV